MTQLRQKMLEELQRRHYSDRTAKPTSGSSATRYTINNETRSHSSDRLIGFGANTLYSISAKALISQTLGI
jgi:hypothetical protein